MIDRSKYTWKYAPPATELIQRWASSPPTGKEIELFFLNELCETSEHEYFLALADVFYDAVTRQEKKERTFSLRVLWYRLLIAAEFARSIDDTQLAAHFQRSLEKFALLYQTWMPGGVNADSPVAGADLASIRLGALVLGAAALGDLPLARLIARSDYEIRCANRDCESYGVELKCPDCGSCQKAYQQHKEFV
ncbi:MAG: hypothetical protein ACR2NP_02820 [Pirellulaceae bacterium]